MCVGDGQAATADGYWWLPLITLADRVIERLGGGGERVGRVLGVAGCRDTEHHYKHKLR